MGRPNCSRVLAYSEVSDSAPSSTPSCSAHTATVRRSVSHSTIAAPSPMVPSTRSWGMTARSSSSRAATSWPLRCCGTTATPGSSQCTRNTVRPEEVSAGTMNRSASGPEGTAALLPVISQLDPSLSARVTGWAGAENPAPASAVVSTNSPIPATSSQRACCVWLPNAASAIAVTACAPRGSGATRRPISTSTPASSRMPSPLPLCSSGTVRAISPESAKRRHRSWSKRTAPDSTSRSRSGVQCLSRMVPASSPASTPSGVCSKSMPVPLSLGGREPEADVPDDVALDLVGAAAEGHHQRGPVEALEAAAQHGAAGAGTDQCLGPDDLHQRPVDLGGHLGAVDLGRGRVGGGEVLGRGGQLPVEQLEHVGTGVGTAEQHLHPLGVDHAAPVGVARLLGPVGDQLDGVGDGGRGRQRHALVVELVGHQRPAAVELADEVVLRHPDVLVVGRT